MCEYCGCQALEAVATLTAEHDAVVDLLGRARAALDAGDPASAAGHARRVAAILAPHTAVEERALFPALAAEFPGHVRRLAAEHRRIDAVLADAARDPLPVGWEDRLRAVIVLLRVHILAEQDGVFPAALAMLSPQDWAALDAVRAEVGSGLATQVAHAAHPAPADA